MRKEEKVGCNGWGKGKREMRGEGERKVIEEGEKVGVRRMGGWRNMS